jgi:hypothetical protein
MTIINVALAADRAMIVCDELVSGAATPLRMSKCQTYPHLRLCVAVAGHHSVAVALSLWLNAGNAVGRDVAGIVADAPGYIRETWADDALTSATTVFLVGVTPADEVAAYLLSSATSFEPRALAPGVWLCPNFAPEVPATPPQTAPEPTAGDPTVSPAPAASATWAWRDATQMAVEAVQRQHREQRVPIGGRVQSTLLTPDAILQTWLMDAGT